MSVAKTSLRNFFAHKGRMVLAGMAVVLSVAFVCGTLVFTATMTTTFDKLFAESASNVMVSPADSGSDVEASEGSRTGRPDTLPASLVEEIKQVDGVAEATGLADSANVVIVDSDNENVGPTTGAPTVALNWSDLELRSMEVTEGSPPSGSSEAMIDADTANKHDLTVGDELRILSATGDLPVTISGIATFQITNPGAAIVYLDLPTAQEHLLGARDVFTRIYVDSDGQFSDEELRDRVAAAIGEDDYRLLTEAEFVEENQNAFAEVMGVIQWVLLGFAGISLLVGIFLIVNTFSMLVAQRTREIGLMRAIGAGRRQINRSVLIEALLLGVVGSVIGFGAGIGLAVGLMALMSTLGMNLSTDDLTIGWNVPVIGIVLGTLVTMLAAYIPARRAGRITPMAALRDAGMPGDIRAGRVRAGIGIVLTLIGAAALAATTTTDEAATAGGYLGLGIVLSLIGLILAAPILVGLVVRGLSFVLLRVFGPIGRLAERNALRNPRRTGATASALMIGLALVAGLSVVGSSMVASASEEIDNTVGADYIIMSSNWMPVLPEATAAVHDTDHLAHVTELRQIEAEVTFADGESTERTLSVAPPTFAQDLRASVAEGDLAQAYGPGGMAIGTAYAEQHGLSIGDQVDVSFQGGDSARLTLRAFVEFDDTMESETWSVGLETVREHVPEEDLPLPMVLFAKAENGMQDEARAALDAALEPYPQMEVRDQAEYKELIEGQVGQLLNMVYGLLALAIIVAILGVVNTLALSVVERTREIGLMRAIGLSRLQLRRMIRLESVVIALFGALLGVGLGLAWGAAGQQLLAMEGMKVLEIPWGTIIGVFVGAALVGLLAALMPAFRAGRMNVLNAIATE
ncbi:FtsX-like permease family protein [Streptomyces sodiiphilus]|uniref:FtsX-like permease family protein n=1 Tax=Streptomyces sodiiphilus TaxID=226217 RepID=A0ABN2P8I9_9ACTN